jgi:hypothetical protein
VGAREVLLAARFDGAPPSEDAAVAERAAALAESPDVWPPDGLVDKALAEVRCWLTSRAAAEDAGVEASAAARGRRAVLARIDAVLRRAPRHERPRLASLAAAARAAAAVPLGEAAERRLIALASDDVTTADDEWLRAVVAIGDGSGRDRIAGDGVPPTLIALVVLVPE